MPLSIALSQFLASVHPYDGLPDVALANLAEACGARSFDEHEKVFEVGDEVTSLYVIVSGEVEITDEADVQLSILGPRNSFGERALLRGDLASRTAIATAKTEMIVVPSAILFELIDEHTPVARFFNRRSPTRSVGHDLITMPVETLMSGLPITCPPDTSIQDAAAIMHEGRISSICIADAGGYKGIVTERDMTGRVVAAGADISGPIGDVMSTTRLNLGPDALVADVLQLMMERSIGHIPITDGPKILGIITKTDLTRELAMSSADLVGRVAQAADGVEMARATWEIPALLVQLVEAGHSHEVVTRLITDIADTATRRLLSLAEETLGAAPVPYLWLACGSQGRQEQTGVADQDNCLILSDDVSDAQMPYFADLAKFVSDGLDACGYFYCPGDMMATNPRWCQPLRVWRDYFNGWIAKPNPEAQMLASVMFDLRPIGGETDLFENLQVDTLKAASANSIFTAHMISNSLKHQPPLGLLRGLATIRTGEYRDRLDLKHNGVVPVVDLGRIYMLQGQLRPVNTRARLEAAMDAGVLSKSGGADLLNAYDLIASVRLKHQVTQIKAGGAPTNYLDPSELSDFERSHLRDAFVVIKTMQSAAGSGKGTLR